MGLSAIAEQRDVLPMPAAAMEPQLRFLLDAKRARQGKGDYKPRDAGDVAARLTQLLRAHEIAGQVGAVRRMGGGASKEQFLFELTDQPGSVAERLVLRMDPLEGIVETCRTREAEILTAMEKIVPAPRIFLVDPVGRHMGQPAMIMRFVHGATKPRDAVAGPSGLGIVMGERAAAALAPQYINNLVAIHGFDYAKADLPNFTVPRAGSREAALWQLNFWARVLEDDGIDASPLLTFTECWLRERVPVCAAPVLLHGDYRLGNFMFDEDTLEITAILDWELAHIGDFHEDLAYSLEPLFCSRDEAGEKLIASMMTETVLLESYTRLSGRVINRDTLLWYHVLNSFKLSVMNFASGVRAARDGTNHQSAFLGYLSACHVGLSGTLCQLLERGSL